MLAASLVSTGFVSPQCASRRSPSVQPCMSVEPERRLVLQAQSDGFWTARTAAAQHKGATSLSLLDELQQRETIFLAQLAEQRQRTRELEAALAQQSDALLASTAAAVPSVPSTLATGNLEAALDEAQQALAVVTRQREVDVQKVGAFWLDKLQAARSETAAEAPAPAAAVQDEPSTAERLRAQYEEQAATAALQAERQLQATSAFWVERAAALEERAAASEARAATLEAALAEQAALAESHVAEAAAVSALLEERELRAERELQSTAAFWLERLRRSKLDEERRLRILQSAVETGDGSSLALGEEAAAVAASEPDAKGAAKAEQGEGAEATPAEPVAKKRGGWQPAWKTW